VILMVHNTVLNFFVVSGGTLFAACLVIYVISTLEGRKAPRAYLAEEAREEDAIFVFDGEALITASQSAHKVLSVAQALGSDWARFLSVLLHRFPTLQSEMERLPERKSFKMDSCNHDQVLQAEWRDGRVRISLKQIQPNQESFAPDHHTVYAMEQELDVLRSASEKTPFLVWRTLKNGTVTWVNEAYLALSDAQDISADTPSWPPKPLFDPVAVQSITVGGFKRLQLLGKGEDSFEVFSARVGEETMYSAICVNRTVEAEVNLREFMQTLTKTFAYLTIGLAIFDRDRKLVLFNPALTDLTALPADFLSMQPALTTFLDRMRNQNMMPEPRDYKSWRQEVSELEEAAINGSYEEIWSLSGGVTYKVCGRPHADGAIAFLFEDISAEISLTRRFRAQIETNHAVFDALDEAVCVFENDGTLLMTNAAYIALWGEDGLDRLQPPSVEDASQVWSEKCAPSAVWSQFGMFVYDMGVRSEWVSSARLVDGRSLKCRFVPLPGGQTFVGFVPEGRARVSVSEAKKSARSA
jgi:PAS domain-containing protein